MRAWLVMAVCSVVFVACDFNVRRCTVDADCESPGVCSAEKFCTVSDGGGTTGGGTATGGGGSTGGGTGGSTGGGTGGSTGGGTGGSTGGGGGPQCPTSCPVGEACLAGESSCQLRLTGIVIDMPMAPFATKQTSFMVNASLMSSTNVAYPPEVSARIDSGPSFMLTATSTGANTYQGSTPALMDGMHTLQASFGTLVSPPLTFTVDTAAPRPSLPTALPGSDFKRDDLYKLALNSSEPLSSTTVTFGDALMQPATGACVGDAGCWTLDLSAPTLNLLEGDLTILVNATDAVGNSATFDAGTVHVTRIRWDVQPIAGEPIRAAPAIGRDGTLFYGSSNGAGTAGSLVALDPTTGAQTSSFAVGGVISVATAVSTADAGLVYFTANATTGLVGARLDTNLATAAAQAANNGNLGKTYSALALVALVGNGTEVGAVSAFNSVSTGTVPGSVVVYWPTSQVRSNTNTPSPYNILDFAVVPDNVPIANNLIINSALAFLPTRQDGVGMSLVRVSGSDTTTPTVGTATDVETGGNDCCFAGQSSFGMGALIGGYTAGARKLYSFNPTLVSGNLTTAFDNGLPAVDTATRAFVGRGNDLVVFSPSSLTVGGTALRSGAGTIRTSPVLGASRPSQSVALGYAVNSGGQLFVFDQNSTVAGSAHDFGSIFSTAGTVYAHPNLDCNRRAGAATSTTGILYVTNIDGRVAAIIVDSPQLSRTAAWPRYQRTAGNAGNTDSRFPLNPGCPGN